MTRSGLRFRFEAGVHKEVREACIKYAKWLRKEFEFPILLVFYIKKAPLIKNKEKELVSATFFAPYSKNVEPYARVATGYYCKDKKERGKDDALASILCSINHEFVHYLQWINNKPLTERGVEKKADSILNKYSSVVDHP